MSMIFPVSRMRGFSNAVFEACGVDAADAAIITECLIHADLRGHASHGLTRIPIYAERILAGVVNKRPAVGVQRSGGAFLHVDGDNGPGPVVTMRALSAAMEVARAEGVCAVSIAHSNHNGSGSFYVEQAVKEGFLAIAMTNAPPSMAVHGGREAVLGTNPITFGTPVEGEAPVLLDMATSVVARGKIVEAAKRHETIPQGWALDAAGKPTLDAREAEKGVVLPMAGPKGSALAIMVEILCGVMSGGRFGSRMGNLYSDFETPQDVGHFLLLIDTRRSPPGSAYAGQVRELVKDLKNSARAEGFENILMPGELEMLRSNAMTATGITLPDNVIADLEEIARKTSAPGLLPPVTA